MEGEFVSRNKFVFKFRIILLIFTMLVSAYLFIHSSVFNLTQLEVVGNDKVSKEEIIALSGLAPGINIFEFDEVNCAQAIEVHPMIKNAEIERKLTQTVSIKIDERQVWALIPYDNLFLCIDDTGVCFDKLNYGPIDKDLIITIETMPERVNLGQAVNTQATDMIRQVWEAIPPEEQQTISQIHYQNQDNTIKIYTIKGTEVRFGNLERLDEKVRIFTQVIQIENELEGKDVLEYVDIRYKGEPVLKIKD